MESPNEAPRQTIRRRPDEPRLEIGETITTKEGLTGVVVARYTPSGGKRHDICYIVELQARKAAHAGGGIAKHTI